VYSTRADARVAGIWEEDQDELDEIEICNTPSSALGAPRGPVYVVKRTKTKSTNRISFREGEHIRPLNTPDCPIAVIEPESPNKVFRCE
jgi:hypothetical protein